MSDNTPAASRITSLDCPDGNRALSIAMILVKSKPTSLSINEYLRLLRAYIGSGGPSRSAPVGNHIVAEGPHSALGGSNIDASGYWKDICQKYESSHNRQTQRLLLLERGHQMLEERLQALEGRPRTPNSQRKRKRPLLPKDGGDINPKFPNVVKALGHASVHSSTGTKSAIRINDFKAPVHDARSAYNIRTFSFLQNVLSQQKSRPEELKAALDCWCSDLSLLIAEIGVRGKSSPGNKFTWSYEQSMDIENARLRLIGRTFSVSLTHSKVFAGNDEATQPNKNHFIYSEVEIFEAVMRQIGKLLCSTPNLHKDPQKANQSRRRTERSNVGQARHSLSSDLAKLFLQMLAKPDLGKVGHPEIFEGALFVLLHRVRTVLKGFILDEARKAARQSPLSGSEDVPCRVPNPVNKEAPLLIWMLEHALDIATVKEGGASDAASGRGSNSPRLSAAACSRLRSMVLRAFKDDGGRHDECLNPSDPIPQLNLNTPPVKHRDNTAKWFASEVWRLIV